MVGDCECGNESRGSTKGGEFLDCLSNLYKLRNKDSVPLSY